MTDFTATKILYGPLVQKRINVHKLPVRVYGINYVNMAELQRDIHHLLPLAPGIHYVYCTWSKYGDTNKMIGREIMSVLDNALNEPDHPEEPCGHDFGALGTLCAGLLWTMSTDFRNALLTLGLNPVCMLKDHPRPIICGQCFVDQNRNIDTIVKVFDFDAWIPEIDPRLLEMLNTTPTPK